MIRWSIALLVVLNLALAAWNFGAFSRWGWAPQDGREPERLNQQIQPDSVQLRPLQPSDPAQPASGAEPAADTASSASVSPPASSPQ